MKKFIEDVGTVRWAVIAAIVGLFLTVAANAQTVTWRLVGSSYNVGAHSMTCVYEGRLSNGQTTTTTTIVPGTFCPSAPGASW